MPGQGAAGVVLSCRTCRIAAERRFRISPAPVPHTCERPAKQTDPDRDPSLKRSCVMYDELTEVDIKKMQEEINYRTGSCVLS